MPTLTAKKVREIRVPALHKCEDDKYLGYWASEKDYDEYIHEDVDVYIGDEKTPALVFRVKALKTITKDISKEGYDYWQWVSKALFSDQRGHAAGREIVSNPEIRLTVGQDMFFKQATKGKIQTLEEARAVIDSDTRLSRSTFYVKKTEQDNLVNMEEVEKWSTIVRKKKGTPEELTVALDNRNKAKLTWFENWLQQEWLSAEDKVAAARAGKKRYVTNQPRANKCHSNIVGAFDRSARIPYGRLSGTTLANYEGFASFAPFYQEVNQTLKETMPDDWKRLYDKFRKVKDPRYNLFDTAFTTLTVNHNFQTAFHRDGNNCENGIAVLSAITQGTYDGFGLIFPELRLGFDLRDGDFLAGDNQGLIHGQLPMTNASPDAESIWFVFYSRERMVSLDSIECEICRKDFMDYASKNLRDARGTGEAKWNGIYEGMWTSDEWNDYKEEHCPEASNTNYWCT